jgi:hypothetical protein
MGVLIDNCVKMDSGLFLCWDKVDNCCYVINLEKQEATSDNTEVGDWVELAKLLANKNRKEG